VSLLFLQFCRILNFYLITLLFTFSVDAQTIPSSSDVGRVKPIEKKLSIDGIDNKNYTTSFGETATPPVPDKAKEISFTLKKIQISGGSVFSKAELSQAYNTYLNQTVTLENVYKIAEKITKKYRDRGYFLSVAFLPQQNIVDGVVTLQIIEGYIRDVDFPKNFKKNHVIESYIQKLISIKPVKTQDLESFLLRLNDLPGYTVKGTLSPVDTQKDGAVTLLLQVIDEKSSGQIGIDNYSSRFLGTHELVASYTTSLSPLHQTTISAIKSLSFKRLSHLTLKHEIAVVPDFTLEFIGSYTDSVPGLNLEILELESNSTLFSTGIHYQWIRQRDENLLLKFNIDARDTNSDILQTSFIRDRIRALRFNVTYDVVDKWQGFNLMNATLSQGITTLGASKEKSKNLSRAEAVPDFKKIEVSITRLQSVADDVSLLLMGSGQLASSVLFSAEEFSYGGQSFGRAFDASEITGEHGIAALAELRYNALKNEPNLHVQPYLFYDIGRVWNEDIAQSRRETGASTGFGVRVATDSGLNINAGLAMPLLRRLQNPIYGHEKNEPRIAFQVFQKF
jgi:hemolysin activation/secretion protein